MPKEKTEYFKLDQYLDCHTNEFVCRNCKTRQSLELPVKFSELTKLMNKFRDEHKNCEDV